MKEKATFPTPFQWIYYIAYFVCLCKRDRSSHDQKREEIQKEKSKKYLKLMKMLVEIQQHKRLENTEEDKLADLRKDLRLDLEQIMNNHKNQNVLDEDNNENKSKEIMNVQNLT